MDPSHRTSDRQSLLLTQAAIDAIEQEPSLVAAVIDTLDHWDRVAPAASRPLRDQWRHLLAAHEWAPVLDPGERGQQLRQASPLGRALSPARRLAIIRACKGNTSNT